MKSLASRSSNAAGFTLVEILVSLAVLGLMMIGVAQILNGTMTTALGAYKHMDADTQARTVLDRMAYDIAHIVKRPDVDYYFQKNTSSTSAPYGNDQMAFYSESSGYYSNNVTSSAGGGGGDVSLVGYMIAPMQNGVYNAATGTPQLCRLSKGLAWNGYNSSLAMVFNPLANVQSTGVTSNTITSNWPGISTGTDSNYQPIGDQVFRLEYTFLVQSSPSGLPNTGTGTATLYTSGGFYDKPWAATTITNTPNSLKDVTAIVVSIAVLDNKSRAMLGTGSTLASSLNSAASALNDDTCQSAVTNYSSSGANTTGYLPLTLWKTNLLAPAHLNLPKAVYSQVRFYQRFCYLNHVQ